MEDVIKVKPKRKKPQGKINRAIVVRGILEGKKQIDIAREAGSLAKSPCARSKAIGVIVNSSKFQKLLDKHLSDQLLVTVHKQGLQATSKSYEYVENEDGKTKRVSVKNPDYNTRHRYLETAYKIKGKLQEQPQGNTLNINIDSIINEYAGSNQGASVDVLE